MTRRMPRRAAVVAAAALLAALGTAGCTSSQEAPDTPFVTPAPPGGATAPDSRRGEEAPPPRDEATIADLAFVASMIVHHEQAVELAALAPPRAADSELAGLASRIAVVQAAEADAMRLWLDRRRSRDLPAEAHDGATSMPGEISRSTIDRAEELDGAAFDELFIGAMIPHHRAAVQMAEARLAEAGDPAVARWARSIATSQSLEIDRLLEIEARLAEG